MQIESLKFDDNGLIPAIVQDLYSGKVLMMAYMNKESLEISIREKRTCFWSRSRQEVWRKGETSGNYQNIVSIAADCDGDTLLVKVQKEGPACHTGNETCFFTSLYEDEEVSDMSMDSLYELINGRKIDKKEGSYTTYLFDKGEDKILKKVGEECTEVVIAAKNNDNEELIYELADLAYHSLVLMVEKGIPLEKIRAELASRHVVDKKVKQGKMGKE